MEAGVWLDGVDLDDVGNGGKGARAGYSLGGGYEDSLFDLVDELESERG
jgi:hypothetical protein